MLHALIMAGGGGTRFWPRSRQSKPKQFLKLVGDRTLLQQALDRIEAIIAPGRTRIITGASYVAETARQLPSLPAERIVGEPCGRDTAACIGLGAALCAREDADAIMLVMPADHVIEPAREFQRAVHVAEQIVLEHPHALVTFGIRPTFAATGYGYIERGNESAQRQGVLVYPAASFREKPHIELAEQYAASGQHFWNSGIFVWKAATILTQLRANQPKLAAAVERIAAAWDTPMQGDVLAKEYTALDRISIDYAVMEKAAKKVSGPFSAEKGPDTFFFFVVLAPFQWDDVGSWLALERRQPQDAHDNTVLAHHLGIDTHHCVIAADEGTLVATLGVSDLIIIQDGNAMLIAHRNEEGNIKKIVEQLKATNQERYL